MRIKWSLKDTSLFQNGIIKNNYPFFFTHDERGAEEFLKGKKLIVD